MAISEGLKLAWGDEQRITPKKSSYNPPILLRTSVSSCFLYKNPNVYETSLISRIHMLRYHSPSYTNNIKTHSCTMNVRKNSSPMNSTMKWNETATTFFYLLPFFLVLVPVCVSVWYTRWWVSNTRNFVQI